MTDNRGEKMIKSTNYYCNQLSGQCLTLYNLVVECVRYRGAIVKFPNTIDKDENCFSILERAYNDHPEFYYLDLHDSTICKSNDWITIYPSYICSCEQQKIYDFQVQQSINLFLDECFPDGHDEISPIEKEKRVFDWITKNVTYDDDAIKNPNGRSLIPTMKTAWGVFGALVLRTATCHGIACAFKLLCDKINLPCIVVCDSTPKGRHAWNIVYVKDHYYHVDCTWDLRSEVSFEIPFARYRYFNLPDLVMSTNHSINSSLLPICNSLDFNPFNMRGFCVHSEPQLFDCIQNNVYSGNNRFAILCLDFNIKQETINKTVSAISQRIKKQIITYFDSGGFFVGFVIKKHGK